MVFNSSIMAGTKKGKCPNCNNNVEYDKSFNFESLSQQCHCIKCDWNGWECYKDEFIRMETH